MPQSAIAFARPLLSAALVAVAIALPAHAQRPEVVFEPTLPETVERMLNLADVRANDFVIDLGSGDGRIVIAAAKRGARGLGVELDPNLIRESNAKAQAAGVIGRVTFRQEDLFKTDLSDATVITLYLLPEMNERLLPRLLALRPGTRVVSNRFPIGDWKPDVTDTEGAPVHLWFVPANVAGRWQLRHGEQHFMLEFGQRYQEISGTAQVAGAMLPIRDARLRGTEIEFLLDLGGQPTQFRGTVAGNTMRGAGGGFGFWRYASEWMATR